MIELSWTESLVLGIIQGLTEFLPVSSSGHLILGARLLGLPAPGLSFSIWVHVGTMLATLFMLYNEIMWIIKGVFAPRSSQDRSSALNIVFLVILASIPAAICGLLFNDIVEKAFNSVLVASLGLIFTGIYLFLSRNLTDSLDRVSRGSKMFSSLSWKNALAMGMSQAVAIIPGVSRSGTTITTGLFSGVKREDAARFSFLLSIPAIAGAALLDVKSLVAQGEPWVSGQCFLGGVVSFLAGLLALRWVFRLVRHGEFYRFSYYCVIVGIIGLISCLL